MFFTCCILHNIILSWDGLDKKWEDDVEWEGDYGLHDDPDEDDWKSKKMVIIQHRALYKLQDFSFMSCRGLMSETRDAEDDEAGFYSRRSALIDHFYYLWTNKRREIEWLN